MSLLDDHKLVTHGAPKTYGDQLPGHIHYKDGVEEVWTPRESKAIRGLAAGYSPHAVAEKCRVPLVWVKRRMGNPYFMLEVQRLADHNVFQFRPKVLEAVAKRAIAGSPQHARLFLQVTRDLKEETPVRSSTHAPRSVEEIPNEQLDDALAAELKSFLADSEGK